MGMSLQRCLNDHDMCLRAAGELLGESACAVELSWECQQLLRPHLRFELRRGLRDEGAILWLGTDRPGRHLTSGMERYRVTCGDRPFPIVRVYAPLGGYGMSTYYDFWAVGQSRYRDFYRVLRRLEREATTATPPLLPSGDADRLHTNTVGFLRSGCEVLRRYGVPQRRGVMLLGPPGTGKTMACRWIRAQCQRHGLACSNVSAEEFSDALRDGDAHTLFELPHPGVIFFDDFDSALRDRDGLGTSTERSLFLSGLDGIDEHHGVVYVFTSNARVDQIDPAMRRPGRIDFILTFRPPGADLRRSLITDRWHDDLLRQISLDTVIQQTDGMTFAELEELKKLLVLQLIATGNCSWDQAYHEFQVGRDDGKTCPILGFAAAATTQFEPALPQTVAQDRSDTNGNST